MNHIDDLAPFINANADVILHLEAGMLGEWGEWHDGPMADWNTQASFDSKYRIVKKMLQTWDARLPILIRYPLDSHEILTRTMPPPNCALANGCLLTQAEKDRVGFHNDCVLADPADQGTYDIGSSVVQPYTPAAGQRLWVQDSDPAFRASYGGSKMVGGESCDSAGDDPTDCSNALATWKTFQWTEINEDYAPVNTSVWKAAQLAASGDDPAETCWIRMKRKLGYRLRVVDATFPKTITLGESHAFSGHLSNDGWASPVKARPAFVVLDRPGGPDRFVAPLADVDVRRWKSGAVVIADERFVPTGLAPGGGYRLSLWLPDPAQGLQADPSYAIALANIGIWDASTGLNVLATDLTVVASAGNRSNSSRASGCSATQDGGAGGASGSEAAANDGGTASPERDSGGSVGTDSAAGTGGSAGGGLWGPNGPKKQFSCPAPPYAAQMSGASTDVCANFTFNYNWSEGPTWIASEGAFFFSNYPIGQPTGGDILKYTPGGGCEIWLHDVGCNGLGVSPSGNLLAACQSARAVMEYDVKTKVGRQIATMVDGKMLDTPNDLIARSDGNIYFSNRTAENGNRPVGLGPALVRIDPASHP